MDRKWRRGRQKVLYKRSNGVITIRELSGMNYTQAKPKAQNRKAWRNLTKQWPDVIANRQMWRGKQDSKVSDFMIKNAKFGGIWGQNKQKLLRATLASGIKQLRVLDLFSGPDLVFLISFIHQVLIWANICKAHLGLGLNFLWALTKFLGQLTVICSEFHIHKLPF